MEHPADPESRIIYGCFSYETSRHTKHHTAMYFLKPEDCFWALSSHFNKVRMLCVNINSQEYRSALGNSTMREKTSKDEFEMLYPHLFNKE
jgi:hypothetical protein